MKLEFVAIVLMMRTTEDDTSEAWILSVEGNDKPMDAEFPLDRACEEHTYPWNCAEGGRDLGPSNVRLRTRMLSHFLQAVVAPVEEEIGRAEQPNPAPAAQEAEAAPRPEETQGMRLEREARDLAATWQSSRRLGQPLGEGGPSSGSNVEDMRNRLRTLGAPVWGTKAQMWPRLVHAEARRELQKRDEAWLPDGATEVAEARGQGELRVHELQTNPQLRNEHAMQSHTCRINRGVRGVQWRKVVRNHICSDQWRA